MGHIPSCLVASHFKLPLELFGGDPFLGRADHVNSQKPFDQRDMGIMKDSSCSDGILIATINALIEVAGLPGFSLSVEFENPLALAPDASKTLRPTDALKVSDAGFLGAEPLDDFKNGRLCFHIFPYLLGAI